MAHGKCPYGCTLKENICTHLEYMLPSMEAGNEKYWDRGLKKWVNTVYTPDVEWFRKHFLETPPPQGNDPTEFYAILNFVGVVSKERRLLTDRFVKEMSYQEIADRYKLPNKMVASRMVGEVLDRIRQHLRKLHEDGKI